MSHILLFTQEYYTWSTILANNSWVYVLTACMGMRLDSRIMKPVTNFTPHLNFFLKGCVLQFVVVQDTSGNFLVLLHTGIGQLFTLVFPFRTTPKEENK